MVRCETGEFGERKTGQRCLRQSNPEKRERRPSWLSNKKQASLIGSEAETAGLSSEDLPYPAACLTVRVWVRSLARFSSSILRVFGLAASGGAPIDQRPLNTVGGVGPGLPHKAIFG